MWMSRRPRAFEIAVGLKRETRVRRCDYCLFQASYFPFKNHFAHSIIFMRKVVSPVNACGSIYVGVRYENKMPMNRELNSDRERETQREKNGKYREIRLRWLRELKKNGTYRKWPCSCWWWVDVCLKIKLSFYIFFVSSSLDTFSWMKERSGVV